MYLLVGMLAGLGCYALLLELFHAPTVAAMKAAANVGTEKTGIMDPLIDFIALKLSHKIKIQQQIYENIQSKIQRAKLDTSVEAYLIRPYIYGMLGAILGSPILLILPIAYLGVLLICFFIFRSESKRADKIIASYEREIEKELSRFVMTIAQELNAGKSVFRVLSNCRKTAGVVLKNELTLTVSEMQIGSQEQALLNLGGRINHPLFNNVVKGLLSRLRGDDTTSYFANLAEDLKFMERNRMKLEAIKIPGKFEKYNFILFIFFALLFFVPLVIQFIDNINIFLT